jgi:AraC-like DNA-binding protein
MAVSAPAAKIVTPPANSGHQDMRDGAPVLSGTYPFEIGEEVVTGWHFHELHQLEYAFEGVAQVETSAARYLLPPQQAIWIPAGVEHNTTLTRVRTVSVFFDPVLDIDAGERVRVIAAAPVIREMILHARRWPITRHSTDAVADQFLATLAELIVESLDDEIPLCLPTSRHALVDAAMRFTVDNQSRALTLEQVCVAVGTSERSLRRAFLNETGMTWRRYLLESRLLRAMALLAEPGPNLLEVATAVGFDSMSGFHRAFRRYTGETPLDYRRRVVPGTGVPVISGRGG